MNRNARIITSLLIISGLVVASFYTGKSTANNASQTVETATNRDQYPLLANRIFIDDPNDPIVNFSELRNSLTEHINTTSLKGSVYFEYLPTGTSIRIGAERKEVAASLIKLPAAMSLYKSSELGIVNLDDTITLKEEWLDSAYGELYKKGAGYQLTLREATKIMLTDSDNTALKAVANYMGDTLKPNEGPFQALDVDYIQNQDLTVSISARSYSSILKCLYFSCYLSKEDSQELLTYLSETKYPNRLVAGIDDKDVIVAHKTGNFGETTQSDCGIIYYPKRNYLLCVMIESADSPEDDKKIAEISKISYDFIDNLPK